MKYSNLRKKFKHKFNFVKPLYKRVGLRNRVMPKSININIESKLHGRGFYVKRNGDFGEFSANRICPNSSKEKDFRLNGEVFRGYNVRDNKKMINLDKYGKSGSSDESRNNKRIFCHKALMTWIRVYPAPNLPNESLLSIIFRCAMCQVGLGLFILSWTLLWLVLIRHFEEPHELRVASDFSRAQNQLVIDLATELRQVSNATSKWRELIEARIEQERKLTVLAVGRGAKLHPGQYWDLPGTFLFTIFVMTTLGFGAPVPQTNWGRTCTVMYGAFAVPAHVYFMVNVSTGLIYHVELYRKNRKWKKRKQKDTPGSSRNSDKEFGSKRKGLRKKITKFLSVFLMARGIPLTISLYYLIGAVCFGLIRSLPAVDVIMFPMEFTTSGGLEMVKGHVKVLYALYVEGAVFILACTLSTMKFHSRDSIEKMIVKYRLFNKEICDNCELNT